MKNNKDLTEFLKENNEYVYDNYNFLEFLDYLDFKLDIPFIHVTGSNGKTILSNLLFNVYNENKYKVGLFSYNQFNILNSIKISNLKIDNIYLQKIYEKFYKDINKYELNSYEVIFFISLVLFKENKLDLVIFDTFMGGENDFTNINETPILSIINNVSLEHSLILGRSQSEIAYTKGGIIKKDSKVLINNLNEDCLFAIDQIANKNKSKLYKVNEFYKYEVINNKLHISYYPFKEIIFNNAALYNRFNITTLLETIQILKDQFPINNELIQTAINKFNEIGYFNIFKINNKIIILDNAHNSDAIDILGKGLSYYLKDNITGIIGLDNSKNVEKILGIFQKRVNKLYLTTFDDKNARDKEGYILFEDDYEYINDYKVLINNLINNEDTVYIVITGSEIFVYQVFNYLNNL